MACRVGALRSGQFCIESWLHGCECAYEFVVRFHFVRIVSAYEFSVYESIYIFMNENMFGNMFERI